MTLVDIGLSQWCLEESANGYIRDLDKTEIYFNCILSRVRSGQVQHILRGYDVIRRRYVKDDKRI